LPLKKGSSKSVISDNISELYHANADKKKKRSRKQIVAIAYAVARRSKH
jgi:hypothetical protein